MTTYPQASIFDPRVDMDQRSRIVVIGIGSFGLQVISLLLPRLEMYQQFVAQGERAHLPAAHCGLIHLDGSGNQRYLMLERSIEAFAHVRDIQRLIISQDHRSALTLDAELQDMLAIRSAWQSGVDQREWLEQLIHPMLADEWNYAQPFAHVHVYLVAAVSDLSVPVLYDLARQLAHLRGQFLTHVIISTASAQPQNTALALAAQVIDQIGAHPDRARLLQNIYLLHANKINQSWLQSPGEAAMAACNFLDAQICSPLADTLAESNLPDSDLRRTRAPFSTLGAAKLYVPVAEVLGQVVEQFVARNIAERVLAPSKQQHHAAQQDTVGLCQGGVLREALTGLPLVLVPRRGWRDRLLDRIWRGRSVPAHAALPQVQVARRFWRAALRAHGRPRTVARWWGALAQFEAEVLEQHLPSWIAVAAQRLGVVLDDEWLALVLAEAPARRDPVVQVLQDADPQRRVDALGAWIAQHRPDLPDTPQIAQDALREVLQGPHVPAGREPAALADWLGRRLRLVRGASTGSLDRLEADLRQRCARVISAETGGLRAAAALLHGTSEHVLAARQMLQAWQEADQQAGLLAGAIQYSALDRRRDRLLQAMRQQPYPAALMARLAVFWLLPTIIMLIAVLLEGVVFPPTWALQLDRFVIGWPICLIMAYVLRMGYAWLRVRWEQWQIERLVLGHIDHVIDQQVYGESPERPRRLMIGTPISVLPSWPNNGQGIRLGLMPAYLQAFARQLTAPGLLGVSQPMSLYATLVGAIGVLERFVSNPSQGSAPPCLLYRSVGDQLVHAMLDGQLQSDLDPSRAHWGRLQAGGLDEHMQSAANLGGHIRQTIQTEISRDCIETVRMRPLLRLQHILQLPEHQHLAPNVYVDDLRHRAKPLLDATGRLQLAESTREQVAYILADEQVIALMQQTPRAHDHRLFVSRSSDPFGLSCVTVLNGLTPPSLPFV